MKDNASDILAGDGKSARYFDDLNSNGVFSVARTASKFLGPIGKLVDASQVYDKARDAYVENLDKSGYERDRAVISAAAGQSGIVAAETGFVYLVGLGGAGLGSIVPGLGTAIGYGAGAFVGATIVAITPDSWKEPAFNFAATAAEFIYDAPSLAGDYEHEPAMPLYDY